jgi:predicted  nucleic acid-binding Zn-ribbon protein
MISFLAENPSFQPIYNCAIMMYRDRKELLNMMDDFFAGEDIVKSLNKTNESIIQKLKKENETIMIELADMHAVIADKDAEIADKDTELADMHARLKVLEQQLAGVKD